MAKRSEYRPFCIFLATSSPTGSCEVAESGCRNHTATRPSCDVMVGSKTFLQRGSHLGHPRAANGRGNPRLARPPDTSPSTTYARPLMLDRLTPSSSPSPTCRDALSANAHPQDCSLRTSPNTVPRPAITSSQWTLRTTPLAVMRCRVGSADTAIWCSSPTSPPCDWSPGWKQPPWSPPTCAGQTPPRSNHHPGASCSANWRAWPNVTSPRLSAPNWSFLSLTTPTARRGARATVTSPRPATTT